MSLEGWKDLHCECGSSHFQPTHRLSWHEGQGIVRKTDGEVCSACGKRADNERMLKVVKTKALELKIEELKAESNV